MIFARVESYLEITGADRCVLLDGCFDPIHAGHIRYLRTARRLFHGYTVIVCVAPDSAIREKGREPLFGQMARCAIVDGLQGVDVVIAKDRPLQDFITILKPVALVKGKDWEGKLPDEIGCTCAVHGTQIVYADHGNNTHGDEVLRSWWRHQSEADLAAMEQWIASHPSTPPEAYNAEYFNRKGLVYKYTLEERRIAEGARPDRIKDLWPDATLLDVGCGPGCLLALLRERGLKAWGLEPSAITPCVSSIGRYIHRGVLADQVGRNRFDVVISREVLEHLTIPELSAMVAQLFRVATKAVYITTRFHPKPSSAFSVTDQPDVDPTHQTLLTHQLLRALCVMHGGKRRVDWEQHLDFQNFGCTLAYEVTR